MKKLLASTALAVTLLISGCAGADAPDSKAVQDPVPKVQTAQNKTQQSQAAAQGIKLKLQVDSKNIVVALADNAAAKRLIDMVDCKCKLNKIYQATISVEYTLSRKVSNSSSGL